MDLHTLFGSEPVIVRAELAKHVAKITLTPEGKSYVASGTWNLLGFGSMDGAGGPVRTVRATEFSLPAAA